MMSKSLYTATAQHTPTMVATMVLRGSGSDSSNQAPTAPQSGERLKSTRALAAEVSTLEIVRVSPTAVWNMTALAIAREGAKGGKVRGGREEKGGGHAVSEPSGFVFFRRRLIRELQEDRHQGAVKGCSRRG